MTSALRRKKESKCEICGRTSDGELCRYHREASRRLIKHYGVWRERTSLDWRGYLDEICRNELAGAWIREVAGFMIKKGELPTELKGQST
jgi:DNA topoisomerase-1